MRTTIEDRREEALAAGYRAMQGRTNASYADFCKAFDSWRVQAFCADGAVIGMLTTKADELHVAVVKEARGKWLSRRLIRETFAPILAQYGTARTKVMQGNTVGLDFVKRIREGFARLEFDPATIAAQVGAQVVGGIVQGDAAQNAAQTQANAANQATQAQLQMFNTQNQQQAPYRQAGYNSLSQILKGLGVAGGGQSYDAQGNPTAPSGTGGMDLNAWAQSQGYDVPQGRNWNPTEMANLQPGYNAYLASLPQTQQQDTGGVSPGQFTHTFTAGDLNANLSPSYNFMLQQGLGTVGNLANASGGKFGGNALQNLTKYAEDYASTGYQQAFQNYNTNQANIFSRLSTVAGFGQGANAQSSSLAGSIAPGVAGTIQGAGQAQASGIIGQANALTGGANNALGWYTIGNLANAGAGNPGGAYSGQGIG